MGVRNALRAETCRNRHDWTHLSTVCLDVSRARRAKLCPRHAPSALRKHPLKPLGLPVRGHDVRVVQEILVRHRRTARGRALVDRFHLAEPVERHGRVVGIGLTQHEATDETLKLHALRMPGVSIMSCTTP